MAKQQTYSDLLRHPKWQKKRLEVLRRDRFTCKLCGDKETELHVHHKKYDTDTSPWEYNKEDLITYCKHCHAMVENMKGLNSLEFITVIKRFPGDSKWHLYLYAHESKQGFICMFKFEYVEESNQLTYLLSISADSMERLNAGFKDASRKYKKILKGRGSIEQ